MDIFGDWWKPNRANDFLCKAIKIHISMVLASTGTLTMDQGPCSTMFHQASSDFGRLHQTSSDLPSIRLSHLRDRQLRGIPPPAWCTLHPGRLPHASRICDLSLVGTYWTHQDRHDSKTKANLVAGLSGLSCKLPERVTVQMAINWINCVILPILATLAVPHASHNLRPRGKGRKLAW